MRRRIRAWLDFWSGVGFECKYDDERVPIRANIAHFLLNWTNLYWWVS